MSLADDLNNTGSAVVADALTRRCDLCHAPKGALCTKRGNIRHDLAGRIIHFGRMQPATTPRRGRDA